MPIPAFEGVVEDEGGYAKLEGTRIRVKDLAANYLNSRLGEGLSEGGAFAWLMYDFPHLAYHQISGAISYFQQYPQLILDEMSKEREELDKPVRSRI